MKYFFAAFGIVLLIAFLIVISPLCLIWGVNILALCGGSTFKLALTWKTFGGALLVCMALRGGSVSSSK